MTSTKWSPCVKLVDCPFNALMPLACLSLEVCVLCKKKKRCRAFSLNQLFLTLSALAVSYDAGQQKCLILCHNTNYCVNYAVTVGCLHPKAEMSCEAALLLTLHCWHVKNASRWGNTSWDILNILSAQEFLGVCVYVWVGVLTFDLGWAISQY